MKDQRQSLNDCSPSPCTPVPAQGEPLFTVRVNGGSPHQIPASSSKETEPSSDAAAAEESVGSSPAAACSPSFLDQPNFRRSMDLLLSVGLDDRAARVFALDLPLRRVWEVVERGRTPGMRNPAGLVRTILESGGRVPVTLRGEAEQALLRELEAEHRAGNSSTAVTRQLERTRALPGESEEERLQRVLEEARNRDRARRRPSAEA